MPFLSIGRDPADLRPFAACPRQPHAAQGPARQIRLDAFGRVCGHAGEGFGNDLSPEISPVMARAGWAVGWNKPEFWGREALIAQKEAKTSRLLRGIKATGRGIPRHDMTVVSATGQAVGVVTSGTFSPTLREGIGLALLDRSVAVGDVVNVEVRGKLLEFDVVAPPFVQPSTKES